MTDWRDSLANQNQYSQPAHEKGPHPWQGLDRTSNKQTNTRNDQLTWGIEQSSLAHPSSSNMYGRPTSLGEHNLDTSSMSNEQLFSAIVRMDVPPAPSSSLPSGMQHRQPSVSIEEARTALKVAKASAGSKTAGKPSQGGGESASDEEDGSPEGSVGKSKRVLANRQSAHRSRLRKLQYIQDLENNVSRLQTEIGQIQPQLSFLRDKYTGLSDQNRKLRDRVAALLNEAHFKECLNNSLRQEITQLSAIQAAAAAGSEPPSGVLAHNEGQTVLQSALRP